MARVFIAIGSNQGDRRRYLDRARADLSSLPHTQLIRFSPIYQTSPVGGPSEQSDFLNAVAELDTEIKPEELLRALQQIEQRAGRADDSDRVHWGPRPLDLDILLYGDRVISSDTLMVPHPLMHDRWFVLKPLADLASQAVHPILQMTIGELLNDVERRGLSLGRRVD